MGEAPLTRDDIVGRWTALIAGGIDREATHEWAVAELAHLEVAHPMVREGLEWLSGFNMRVREGNPDGAVDPPAVGEYLRSVDDIAESLEGWREFCALHDSDPESWRKYKYRLRLRDADGSESDGGMIETSEAYGLGDQMNIPNQPDGRGREGFGFIWRVAEVRDEGELLLEFVVAHPDQTENWSLPPA